MKHLVIIGARGWGREVCDSFMSSEDVVSGKMDIKGFLDDKWDALDGYKGNWPKILGPVESYEIQPDDVFFCALGDPKWRKHYAEIIKEKGGTFVSYVHRSALVSRYASIGEGCFIAGYTSISNNVTLGNHVIAHIFSDFGHDASVGDYSTIEAYAFLGGYSSVGALSTMHTKSSILPHKSIGNECEVGTGSVVMRNFKDGNHVFGNPAKKIIL